MRPRVKELPRENQIRFGPENDLLVKVKHERIAVQSFEANGGEQVLAINRTKWKERPSVAEPEAARSVPSPGRMAPALCPLAMSI